MTAQASLICGDPPVTDLVMRARRGDQQAWDALVERYAPLLWSICRRHRLDSPDADDVGQSVWLRLMAHPDNLRDPAALPDWFATTTRRECRRVLRACAATTGLRALSDAENIPDTQTATAEHELLLAERNAVLREALTRLPPAVSPSRQETAMFTHLYLAGQLARERQRDMLGWANQQRLVGQVRDRVKMPRRTERAKRRMTRSFKRSRPAVPPS